MSNVEFQEPGEEFGSKMKMRDFATERKLPTPVSLLLKYGIVKSEKTAYLVLLGGLVVLLMLSFWIGFGNKLSGEKDIITDSKGDIVTEQELKRKLFPNK
jgi:hypothetical protein